MEKKPLSISFFLAVSLFVSSQANSFPSSLVKHPIGEGPLYDLFVDEGAEDYIAKLSRSNNPAYQLLEDTKNKDKAELATTIILAVLAGPRMLNKLSRLPGKLDNLLDKLSAQKEKKLLIEELKKNPKFIEKNIKEVSKRIQNLEKSKKGIDDLLKNFDQYNISERQKKVGDALSSLRGFDDRNDFKDYTKQEIQEFQEYIIQELNSSRKLKKSIEEISSNKKSDNSNTFRTKVALVPDSNVLRPSFSGPYNTESKMV